MKAIKIDVVKKSVELIDLQDGLQPIYDAIGNQCTAFECPVTFPNGDILYTDENGYINDLPQIGGFSYPDWQTPITGNGIILGVNHKNGESQNCITTVEQVKSVIRFYSAEYMEKVKDSLDLE